VLSVDSAVGGAGDRCDRGRTPRRKHRVALDVRAAAWVSWQVQQREIRHQRRGFLVVLLAALRECQCKVAPAESPASYLSVWGSLPAQAAAIGRRLNSRSNLHPDPLLMISR